MLRLDGKIINSARGFTEYTRFTKFTSRFRENTKFARTGKTCTQRAVSDKISDLPELVKLIKSLLDRGEPVEKVAEKLNVDLILLPYSTTDV
jgi:hypothetical protein